MAASRTRAVVCDGKRQTISVYHLARQILSHYRLSRAVKDRQPLCPGALEWLVGVRNSTPLKWLHLILRATVRLVRMCQAFRSPLFLGRLFD